MLAMPQGRDASPRATITRELATRFRRTAYQLPSAAKTHEGSVGQLGGGPGAWSNADASLRFRYQA
jgi:tryptophanyl-tRNA synthetase